MNSEILKNYRILEQTNGNGAIVKMLAEEKNISINEAILIFVDFRFDGVPEDVREFEIAALEYEIFRDMTGLEKCVEKNIAKNGYLTGHLKRDIECLFDYVLR